MIYDARRDNGAFGGMSAFVTALDVFAVTRHFGMHCEINNIIREIIIGVHIIQSILLVRHMKS